MANRKLILIVTLRMIVGGAPCPLLVHISNLIVTFIQQFATLQLCDLLAITSSVIIGIILVCELVSGLRQEPNWFATRIIRIQIVVVFIK